MDNAAFAQVARLGQSLRERLRAAPGARVMVGIAGPPGTGKTTLAEMLAQELGPDLCVVVSIDGFHLANEVIDGTPLRDRKGAIDTFDASGFIAMLRRVRARVEPTVYAPAYRRGLEEPIAGSIPVDSHIPVVIVEGNYLLADQQPWDQVKKLLDEIWYVETPSPVRVSRLIERHVRSGMAKDAATAWANGSDAANARLIESTKPLADQIVLWP